MYYNYAMYIAKKGFYEPIINSHFVYLGRMPSFSIEFPSVLIGFVVRV